MAPEERARRAADVMWANDDASKWLGISLDGVGPGMASVSMAVEKHHTNGHDICHGGYIFTLADTAFAFACNSFNRRAVAQHNTISFLRPGRLGDRLTAEARQAGGAGRTGIYDVEVWSGDDLIATFRGVSREIGGTHFEEESDG